MVGIDVTPIVLPVRRPQQPQDECRAAPAWDADLSEMRDVVQTFEARAYAPPVWARNAHLHTIVASGDMEKKLLGDRTVCSDWFGKKTRKPRDGTSPHMRDGGSVSSNRTTVM